MKKIFCLAMLLILTGCVQYTLVPTGSQNVGPYQFNLDQAWNKAPLMSSFAQGTQVWTEDGLALDALVFWPVIANGGTLFRGGKSNPFPPYTSGMLPTDLEKWIESSLRKSLGSGSVVVSTSNLRPVQVDGKTAFQFEFNYATATDLRYRGQVLAIPMNGGVGVIMYRATSIHYYEAVLPAWQGIIKSLQIRST